MIDRFTWCFCSALILAISLFLPPFAAVASAELQVGAADMGSAPSKDFDLFELSVANLIPQAGDRGQNPSPAQDADELRQRDEAVFFVPLKQTLEGLLGRSEISVSADADRQFSNTMAKYQIFTEELAMQLDEADLPESISAGRRYSRDSHAAVTRMEQAEAQSGQTLGLLLPNIYVRTSRGYETSDPSVVVDEATGNLLPLDRHIRTDLTLTAVQPLFNLPTYLDWRRRKVKELVREEGYRISDSDAFVSTVKTYLSLVASRLQVDVTQDFEAQLAELLRYVETRADAGAASISDMSRVRARSQATQSSRLEQESAHLASGTEFVRLTNLLPQKVLLPKLADVGVAALPESFEAAVAMAMKLNPEIAALAAEVKAETIDRAAAKSVFLPRFDAEYTDTYSRHAGGSAESQRDKRIMLVMNWNLFSGGKDYQYYQERSARHRELRYRLDDQRRRVVQSLSANYATLETTRHRIDAGYRELESISTAAQAMSKRMLSGNQSLLDLLTVYDGYYKVRSRLIDLHVLEMNTVAELIRLTQGTPWPPPEMPADGGQKTVSSYQSWHDLRDPP